MLQTSALEEDIQALSDEQLTGKTAEFKQRKKKAKPWTTLPEVFAVG